MIQSDFQLGITDNSTHWHIYDMEHICSTKCSKVWMHILH